MENNKYLTVFTEDVDHKRIWNKYHRANDHLGKANEKPYDF